MTASTAALAPPRSPLLPRLVVAILATAAVAALLVAIFAALAPPPQPARAPFGLGVREAAPSGGFGATILAVQGAFYRHLQAAVAALTAQGTIWPLVGIGFAYGIFHAAGPGHGKAVIAAYLVADERALATGFGLSLAAALLQAFVAIGLVGTLAIALGATAAAMRDVTHAIELASFGAVALLGAYVTWRKAGGFVGVLARLRDPGAGPAAEACDHVHLPPPSSFERKSLREMAAVVAAAGLRPCAGALVVLVFAQSQGVLGAGIAATFAMALGTALTTGVIAALAVFSKRLALRLAGGRGAAGAVTMAGIELLAAAFVLVTGLSLLFGLALQSGL